MTQTFGWYCPKCDTRWRASICDRKQNLCPQGHSLFDCYWVYRKDFTNSIHLLVTGADNFKINESLSGLEDGKRYTTLRKWIDARCREDPHRTKLYENLQMTSSAIYPPIIPNY